LSRSNTETIDLNEIEFKNDTTSLNELVPVVEETVNEANLNFGQNDSSFDATLNNNNNNNSNNNNNKIVYFKLENEDHNITESKT
jgi:hypothetical protein